MFTRMVKKSRTSFFHSFLECHQKKKKKKKKKTLMIVEISSLFIPPLAINPGIFAYLENSRSLTRPRNQSGTLYPFKLAGLMTPPHLKGLSVFLMRVFIREIYVFQFSNRLSFSSSWNQRERERKKECYYNQKLVIITTKARMFLENENGLSIGEEKCKEHVWNTIFSV